MSGRTPLSRGLRNRGVVGLTNYKIWLIPELESAFFMILYFFFVMSQKKCNFAVRLHLMIIKYHFV